MPLVILALVVAAGFAMFSTDETKTLTAHFPRTISIYEGSEVKVLGVAVGNVDKVTPSGTDVVVEMHYDDEHRPPGRRPGRDRRRRRSSVTATSSSPRSTRAAPSSPTAPSSRTEDTAVPLELDQIYSSLDELNVALGPNGANKNGALHRPARDHRRELRRPGRAVPPDHPGLQHAERDPRRQQGGAVRLGPRARGLHQHPGDQRPDRAAVQPVALQRLRPALRRERGAGGGAAQPVDRPRRRRDLRPGEPRHPRQEHHAHQPGRQGAGQAARGARRDAERTRRWRSTTWR